MTDLELWRWLACSPRLRERSIDLVAGTRGHFTELNRSHDRMKLVLGRSDGVTFSITPTMHSTEIRHIVTSLGAQRDVVRTAGSIAGALPIHIGPITLETRFNAVATTEERAAATFPPDPLSRTPFGAAWMLGSVAALSRGSVASLTYFRVSELNDTEPGMLLAELGALAGSTIFEVMGDDDPSLASFAVEVSGGVRVYLANLGPSAREVVVRGQDGDEHMVAIAPWSHDSVLTAPHHMDGAVHA